MATRTRWFSPRFSKIRPERGTAHDPPTAMLSIIRFAHFTNSWLSTSAPGLAPTPYSPCSVIAAVVCGLLDSAVGGLALGGTGRAHHLRLLGLLDPALVLGVVTS